MDSYKENKQTYTKFNVEKEAEQIFGEMREATTEEELMVKNYIDSISTDNGIYNQILNFFNRFGEVCRSTKLVFEYDHIPKVFVYKKSEQYLLGFCIRSIYSMYRFLIVNIDKNTLLKGFRNDISINKIYENSKKEVSIIDYDVDKNSIVKYEEINFNKIPRVDRGILLEQNVYLDIDGTEGITHYINYIDGLL